MTCINVKEKIYEDFDKALFVIVLDDINNSETIEELKENFDFVKLLLNFRQKPELFKKLIHAKDLKKSQLMSLKINSLLLESV